MSFQQGLSGLNATAKSLEVIGNNIANASTYGAKAARAEFSDVYAAALNGAGANPIGIGVNMSAVSQQFTQGNILTTQNPMDLAINGAGFFQVSDGNNPVTYTRNGQFKVDRDGYIVNNQLQRLLGYPADGNGVIQPGSSAALQLPTSGINPNVTSIAAVEMNLDARAATTAPTAGPQINFTDPNTYNNATSMTLYDQRGQEVALTFYFQKSATDTWNVFATANGTSVSGTNVAPTPLTTMTFPASGAAPTAPAGAITLNVPASTNAAGAATLAIPGVQLDLTNSTQYGSNFGVTNATQDGYSAGQLSSISVESNGVVMARYSNGQSKPAGQIEVASFRNPQGLQPLGGNAWGRSFTSGDPVLGTPGNGNLGVLQAGALEESNVDLTGELVNMITAQRIYQANAQTIKTIDQTMQTLVNLR
ncbi:MAG: flagellar hook protein FlgE [Ideonella sp.]|nr:flagellar hook protein FlgE [Ideonella sp.]MCC7457861.1 flagellar hook protein FlgE [Nitrospira sp.]